MKKRTRIVLASVLALSLVGAFALFGCSNGDQKAEEPQQQQQEPQQQSEGHEAVELQLFAAQLVVQGHGRRPGALRAGPRLGLDVQGRAVPVLGRAERAAGRWCVRRRVDQRLEGQDGRGRGCRVRGRRHAFRHVQERPGDGSGREFRTGRQGLHARGHRHQGDYTVAVGDDSVPAGNYANQALSTVGCDVDASGKSGSDISGKEGSYDGTPLEGKVNLQSSVGNVCKQAESGAVDVAFVYSSDVYRFGGVKVVGKVPADTHKNIVFTPAPSARTPRTPKRLRNSSNGRPPIPRLSRRGRSGASSW